MIDFKLRSSKQFLPESAHLDSVGKSTVRVLFPRDLAGSLSESKGLDVTHDLNVDFAKFVCMPCACFVVHFNIKSI
jgi:hypothetical protein